MTNEEKEFRKAVDEQLGNRDDVYACEFRKVNTRDVGGRGLLLLEKIKAEIQANDILAEEGVTPTQLALFFIDITERYVTACKNVDGLKVKYGELTARYQETFDEGSKNTKKLARDIDMMSRKIEANEDMSKFCLATINAAIMPMLTREVGQ